MSRLPVWIVAAIVAGVTACSEAPPVPPANNLGCVVLLHGLLRSASSMHLMTETLQSEGFVVVNRDYPSRQGGVSELANSVVTAGVAECRASGAGQIHLVGHSLGGILVRQWLAVTPASERTDIQRLVMLAPPNQGSEVVDVYRRVPFLFEWMNGPSILELGTDANSISRRLGPVPVETGIIAGTRTVNWILSQSLPNPDDGKVSVASTRVQGMCAHLALPVSHPMIMKHPIAIAETAHFLRHGRFSSPGAEHLDCQA